MKTKISYLTDEMKKYESDNLKTKFIALKDFIETQVQLPLELKN